MKVHIGDTVTICKGADRGKEGVVLRVLRESGRVVVAGVNIRTLHKKPRTGDEQGSIEKKEMPIACSNVMVVDPSDKRRTRVGYVGSGREKQRVAKRTGKVLKHTPKKKSTPDTQEKS
ncbi:MAG: 50S ribosomal protein L24 [Candidatus Kaiserbacteria bacterium]|nr:50S ribosomal protein L24 [Candidatus Kaiserbacteria bacterium]